MSYHTDFEGVFQLDKPLIVAHAEYLCAFSETRRMARNAGMAEGLPDPLRHAVGLPVGVEGAYYVGGGADSHVSVIDVNRPPEGQPSLWCEWLPTDDRMGIEYNGEDNSFYEYDKWLQYLIDHFLTPWGYTLSGTVHFQGEEPDDRVGSAQRTVACGSSLQRLKMSSRSSEDRSTIISQRR